MRGCNPWPGATTRARAAEPDDLARAGDRRRRRRRRARSSRVRPRSGDRDRRRALLLPLTCSRRTAARSRGTTTCAARGSSPVRAFARLTAPSPARALAARAARARAQRVAERRRLRRPRARGRDHRARGSPRATRRSPPSWSTARCAGSATSTGSWRPHSRRALASLDPRVLRAPAHDGLPARLPRAHPAVRRRERRRVAREGSRQAGRAGVRQRGAPLLRAARRARARAAPARRSARCARPCACRFPPGWRPAGSSATASTKRRPSCARMNERPPHDPAREHAAPHPRGAGRASPREDALSVAPTPYAPEGLIVEHGGAPAAWRAFADGAFAVQDEASMLVARLLDPQPGRRRRRRVRRAGHEDHAPRAAHGQPRTHRWRSTRRRRASRACPRPPRRLGVTIVETRRRHRWRRSPPRWPTRCDGVLVDAPCSNLGVLRRNPEVKWRRAAGDVVGERRAPAHDPHRRRRHGEARRAARLRHVLDGAGGERRGRRGVPRDAAGFRRRRAARDFRSRSTTTACCDAGRIVTAPTGSRRCGSARVR